MAFKMKGSAFKLNNVATKSALKQVVDIAGRPMGTKGRGKRTRYDPEKLIPGRAQWIRDNYGTGLSRRKRMEAHAAYYDAHPPKETAPPEKKEIIYPDPEPKETRYPTHKRTSSTYAGDMPQYKEVWDPTVNNGEGGYVRVEDEPTQTVIPESKATIVDPLADKPY